MDTEGSHVGFFDKMENRLCLTLVLGVAFPLVAAGFFPLFAFVVVPITPFLAAIPATALYIYWLTAAGSWLFLLGGILPLMRKEIPERPSGLRDAPSNINLKRLTIMGSCELPKNDTPKEEKPKCDTHGRNTVKGDTAESGIRTTSGTDPKDSNLKYSSSENINYSDDIFQIVDSDNVNCSVVNSSEAIAHSLSRTSGDGNNLENDRKSAERNSLEPVIVDNNDLVNNQSDKSQTCLQYHDEICSELKETYHETVFSKTSEQCFEESVLTQAETFTTSLPSPLAISDSEKPCKNAVFLFITKDDK